MSPIAVSVDWTNLSSASSTCSLDISSRRRYLRAGSLPRLLLLGGGGSLKPKPSALLCSCLGQRRSLRGPGAVKLQTGGLDVSSGLDR